MQCTIFAVATVYIEISFEHSLANTVVKCSNIRSFVVSFQVTGFQYRKWGKLCVGKFRELHSTVHIGVKVSRC